jgi:hypothetical protein
VFCLPHTFDTFAAFQLFWSPDTRPLFQLSMVPFLGAAGVTRGWALGHGGDLPRAWSTYVLQGRVDDGGLFTDNQVAVRVSRPVL